MTSPASDDPIASFVAGVGRLRRPAAIAARCRRELQAIAEGRALTSFRRLVSRYRVAIAAAHGRDHPSLTVFRLSERDQETVQAEYRKTVMARHTARRPLHIGNLVATARSILDRAIADPRHVPPLELAGALIALTGRRTIEVIRDRTRAGDFQPAKLNRRERKALGVDDGFALIFYGQRKRKTAPVEPYAIPTLTRAHDVVAGVMTLRMRRHVQMQTDEEAGSASWLLGKYCAGVLPTQISPGYFDEHGLPLTPKDLRAAYALACYESFAPRHVSRNAYYARILGHGENDLTTSLSYDVFYSVD